MKVGIRRGDWVGTPNQVHHISRRLYTSHNIIRYGRQNVFQYLSKTHILQRCKFAAYCMYTSSASEGWVNQLYEIYEEIDWWSEQIWCERPAVRTRKKECDDRLGHIAIIPFVSLVCFAFAIPMGMSYDSYRWVVLWAVWKRNDCLSLWQDQQLFAFCASSFFTENCGMQMECWNKNAYGIVQKKQRHNNRVIPSADSVLFLFINNSTRLTGSPTNLFT